MAILDRRPKLALSKARLYFCIYGLVALGEKVLYGTLAVFVLSFPALIWLESLIEGLG